MWWKITGQQESDEQQLIYEGGYEQLFGEISMKGRLIGELLCVLVAVYSAAGLLGMEYDLKVMNLLQSTKKGRGTLLRVKLGVAAGVTTVMFVLVKIPVVMRIVQNYPLTGWTAKVRSMRFAGTSVFNCPVWAYVLLLLLLQLGTLYVVILCVTALSADLKRYDADTDPVGSVIWRYAGHGMGRTWNDSFLEHQYITGRTPSATVRRNAVCTDGTGLLGSPSIGGRNRSAQSL